jgi:hypothetical protein
MNSWIEILFAYREGKFERYFYGLTPRMIFGACQIPLGAKFENNKIAYEVTKQIFEEMQQYNLNGLIVTSNPCEIHKGPVLQFTEAKWTQNSIGISFDSIWNRYGDNIMIGEFGISSYDKEILNRIFE